MWHIFYIRTNCMNGLTECYQKICMLSIQIREIIQISYITVNWQTHIQNHLWRQTYSALDVFVYLKHNCTVYIFSLGVLMNTTLALPSCPEWRMVTRHNSPHNSVSFCSLSRTSASVFKAGCFVSFRPLLNLCIIFALTGS